MRNLIFCFFFLISIVSCIQTSDCPSDINKKPLFGNLKKCPEQIKADKRYISAMEEIFKGDRKQAAQDRINSGWNYFYEGKFDSSIMRFNQAYLLDSNNAEIYWGLGNILGKYQRFNESLEFFEKSLSMDPDNSNAWLSASTTYGQLFYKTKNKKYLDKSIEYLKKAIELDSSNAMAYGQLTAAYSYFSQKDSAKKYLKLTDKIDPNAVKPEVRKFLNEK